MAKAKKPTKSSDDRKDPVDIEEDDVIDAVDPEDEEFLDDDFGDGDFF